MNTDINTAVNAAATAEASLPSIAVPAGATFSVEGAEASKITYGEAFTTLADLIKDQKEWLNGAHRTANEQLYLLLQRCFVSIRRGPPCLGRQRALLSVLLRVCFGAVGGSGDGIFGARAAASVER